jgi:hypothetical protein
MFIVSVHPVEDFSFSLGDLGKITSIAVIERIFEERFVGFANGIFV